MAYEEGEADLFAIPDFWRPSKWLKTSHNADIQDPPFFALDLSGTVRMIAWLDLYD